MTNAVNLSALGANTNSSGVLQPSGGGTGLAAAGPAFSAYLSANQSVSANVFTKITFDTEDFDTNSNFSSSRFTPTVAGYYQLNAVLTTTSGSPAAGLR